MEQKIEEKDNVTLIELKKLEDSSEKLGREIRMLSRAFKKMANSALRKETIVLLVSESSGVGKGNVREVIFALEQLEEKYLNKEK